MALRHCDLDLAGNIDAMPHRHCDLDLAGNIDAMPHRHCDLDLAGNIDAMPHRHLSQPSTVPASEMLLFVPAIYHIIHYYCV